jgi:hypothetical protein
LGRENDFDDLRISTGFKKSIIEFAPNREKRFYQGCGR